MTSPDPRTPAEKVLVEPDDVRAFSEELALARPLFGRRLNADPENVEEGLARLVLTLVELLRRLMEKQALRRVEGGSLSDEEIERLGQTFIALEARMDELKETFGLGEEDLNIDLGPIGKLM